MRHRPQVGLALLATIVVAGMFVAMMPGGEISRGGYVLMAATLAGLIATTSYSIWTCIALARGSDTGARAATGRWAIALLALGLNLWLCFLVLGMAVLMLIGRPIVA